MKLEPSSPAFQPHDGGASEPAETATKHASPSRGRVLAAIRRAAVPGLGVAALEGQNVEAGQVLVELESSEWAAAVAQAEAAVQQAEARLRQLRSSASSRSRAR
jgi:multidrug efflux pump subunit AcrA (membrane-fusion protein)